jgi:hypothetical protein
MPAEPTPRPLGTEMREATLPDGARVIVAVKPGLPQDEVNLIAATAWAQLPDG